jgi:hypothetical protein
MTQEQGARGAVTATEIEEEEHVVKLLLRPVVCRAHTHRARITSC